MHYRLKVECLGEEIGKRDGCKSITTGEERTKVTGECGWIAGDVDHPWRGGLNEKVVDRGAEPGSGRVDDDKVRTSGTCVVAEEIKR